LTNYPKGRRQNFGAGTQEERKKYSGSLAGTKEEKKNDLRLNVNIPDSSEKVAKTVVIGENLGE